jgi:hypothetical protein
MRDRKSNFHYYIIFAVAIGVIAFIILSNQSNTSNSQNPIQSFVDSYENLTNDSRNVSLSLDAEIGKWINREISNSSLVTILEEYEPKYSTLLEKANNIQAPSQFNRTMQLTIDSLKSEIESNEFLKRYLSTGNPNFKNISDNLFSKAYMYEYQAFSAFRNATD